MLDEAAATHPNSWWWVETDGVDLVPGLGESVTRIWSGDVDLNDGKLQKQYDTYMADMSFIQNIGSADRKKLLKDLNTVEFFLV